MSSIFEAFSGGYPTTGINPQLWAGVEAAILVVFLLLAFSRAAQDGAVGALARIALVLVGAGTSLFFFDGTSKRDLALERQALDARALELMTRGALPVSPLACLPAGAGDAIEGACEKALFATPETAAAAVSYVSAQLALLRDYHDYLQRSHTVEPPFFVTLRRAAESDRFGLVAQVLASRDGCTPAHCQAFGLFSDISRVSANLSERTFDSHVAQYAENWPVAGKAAAAVPAVPSSVGRAPGSNIFFPSAASIPPVNIITAEPTGPEPPATTAAASAAKQSPIPPRKPSQPAAQNRSSSPLNLNATPVTPPPAAPAQ